MGGGVIAIRPFVDGDGAAHGAGNTCLYGATGGRLFVSGTVGQRFAVRNSGAVAVVEGASDHVAEYMTGGTVVVLGEVGRNIAAGMTGGLLFVRDAGMTARAHVADTAPPASRPTGNDATLLRSLIEEHVARTGSALGRQILEDWAAEVERFWVLRPVPPPVPIQVSSAAESVSAD